MYAAVNTMNIIDTPAVTLPPGILIKSVIALKTGEKIGFAIMPRADIMPISNTSLTV